MSEEIDILSKYKGIAKGPLQRRALILLLHGELAEPFTRFLSPALYNQWGSSYNHSWIAFLKRIIEAGLEYESFYATNKTNGNQYLKGVKLVGFRSLGIQSIFRAGMVRKLENKRHSPRKIQRNIEGA